VRNKVSEPWIPIERIEAIIQIEPMLVILILATGAWAVYKLFLRGVAAHRHENLKRLFSNLSVHMLITVVLFGLYESATRFNTGIVALERLDGYIGVLTLFAGATVFVKTWRILVFEYLFLGHMKVGVPLLLVNLFTLLLSVVIGGWIVTQIFNIQIAPLLATSAIFSVVLGLAMQDTLGNLFAGVALQFDKPYELGDWVEVHGTGQKWVGQVHEISWRATVLVGLADEAITLPNRVMAQSQISNFSLKTRPIVRTLNFRIPYGSELSRAKAALLQAALTVPSIRRNPAPLVRGILAKFEVGLFSGRLRGSVAGCGPCPQFRDG
jgi:small-conductance mechanosensitive channel